MWQPYNLGLFDLPRHIGEQVLSGLYPDRQMRIDIVGAHAGCVRLFEQIIQHTLTSRGGEHRLVRVR